MSLLWVNAASAVGTPTCRQCGEEIAYHQHWRDIVDEARVPQHEIDQAYAGTDLPEGVEVPLSPYHHDPEVAAHVDALERHRGWRHVNDHTSDNALGLRGRLTNHEPVPHDGRSDREEKMRQADVLLDRRSASYADAPPEARQRRVDRVKKWVDKQPTTMGDYVDTAEIPDHFGHFTHPEKMHDIVHNKTSWFDQGHLLGNVHSHHLPWEEVPLDGKFHLTQPHFVPNYLHHKIDGEHHADEDDMPTEGMFDEHDPTPDPMVLRHKGEHYLMDGHHRFVKNRLLGIPTMHARVYDADDPKAGPEHCYECQEHKEYCSDCGGDEEDR